MSNCKPWLMLEMSCYILLRTQQCDLLCAESHTAIVALEIVFLIIFRFWFSSGILNPLTSLRVAVIFNSYTRVYSTKSCYWELLKDSYTRFCCYSLLRTMTAWLVIIVITSFQDWASDAQFAARLHFDYCVCVCALLYCSNSCVVSFWEVYSNL